MTAANIKEMLDNWNTTEAAARDAYPNASAEEIYQMVALAMNKSLGLRGA